MEKLFFLLITLLAMSACLPILQSRYLTQEDVERIPQSFDAVEGRQSSGCRNWQAYVPDTAHLSHYPMRYVRINVHWMNTADTAYSLGGREAVEFTKGLIRASNYDLNKNRQMYLPYGNETPVVPTRYRYLLTPLPGDPDDDGIYFHYDDELYYYVHKGKNRNLHRREVFQQYGVQMDSVLNVFIMPHHPDSVASPTYNAYGVGVALGNAVKISGIYTNYSKPDDYWNYRGVFNHELGHIYGLSHTWAFNDGCEDTPQHPQNCFSIKQPSPCDTATSNNFMDYAAEQNAWTPCQIGRVHSRMADENSRQRKFMLPTWCTFTDSLSIIVKDTVRWDGAKDLEGSLTIEGGGSLTIACRVSMAPGSTLTVAPGGTLTLENDARLHNACGQQWQGIRVQKLGTEAGKVVALGSPKVEDTAFGLP